MALIIGSATGGEYLRPWGVGNTFDPGVGNTYGPDWGILLALPWGTLMTPAWGNIMTLGGEYFWPSTPRNPEPMYFLSFRQTFIPLNIVRRRRAGRSQQLTSIFLLLD